MTVTMIRDGDHLASELSSAGGKLTVLDFTATWCGPCKHIAPVFDRLSGKYSTTKFLKVDVDDCSDVAQDYRVRSMPTFVFVKNLKEVERFSGADPSALEEMIKKHAPADTFTGSGYTLHSGSGVESTTSTSTTGSQGLGGWLGNLMGGGSGSGSSSTSATSDNEELNQKCEEQAREIFPVDKKVPTCKMQVRFLDGKKMSVTLNNTLTVDQLRQYITVARPSLSDIPFALCTGHPTKVIENESLTLEDANLANAVIVLQGKK